MRLAYPWKVSSFSPSQCLLTFSCLFRLFLRWVSIACHAVSFHRAIGLRLEVSFLVNCFNVCRLSVACVWFWPPSRGFLSDDVRRLERPPRPRGTQTRSTEYGRGRPTRSAGCARRSRGESVRWPSVFTPQGRARIRFGRPGKRHCCCTEGF